MAAPKATGDAARQDFNTLAASVEIPILIDATGSAGTNTLKVATHDINQAAYGKKLGATVIICKADGTVAALAVATGSGKTDKWGIADLATVQITPA